jgi:hypothetical protein
MLTHASESHGVYEGEARGTLGLVGRELELNEDAIGFHSEADEDFLPDSETPRPTR